MKLVEIANSIEQHLLGVLHWCPMQLCVQHVSHATLIPRPRWDPAPAHQF